VSHAASFLILWPILRQIFPRTCEKSPFCHGLATSRCLIRLLIHQTWQTREGKSNIGPTGHSPIQPLHQTRARSASPTALQGMPELLQAHRRGECAALKTKESRQTSDPPQQQKQIQAIQEPSRSHRSHILALPSCQCSVPSGRMLRLRLRAAIKHLTRKKGQSSTIRG